MSGKCCEEPFMSPTNLGTFGFSWATNYDMYLAIYKIFMPLITWGNL